MKITLQQLEDKQYTTYGYRSFCFDKQEKIFKRVFGEEVEITEGNIEIAKDAGLDVLWFIRHFLPETLKTYDEVIKVIWDFYNIIEPDNEVNEPARKIFDNFANKFLTQCIVKYANKQET